MEMGTWKRWIIKKRGHGSPAMKTAILSLTMIVAGWLRAASFAVECAAFVAFSLAVLIMGEPD